MSNQASDVRNEIKTAKERLELLEELELLESEFRFIENEYHQRREQLERRLSHLNSIPGN